MEYIKNLFAQGRELFLGMTPGSRIIAALLGGVLLVSFGYLLMSGVVPSVDRDYTYLGDGREFSQIEILNSNNAFAKAGLSDFDWVGKKLKVPVGMQAKYTAAIFEGNCLINPGDFTQKLIDGMSPLDSMTMMQEKARVTKELELASILKEFSFLEKAHVTVNVRKDRDPKFYDKKQLFSVSANVTPKKNEQLDDHMLTAITRTVKTSLGIQDNEDISIVNMLNGQTSKGIEVGMRGGVKTYAEAQKEKELDLEKKIRETYSHIAGIKVKATANLDDIIQSHLYEVIHKDKPTMVQERTSKSESKYEGPLQGGRPGVAAQLGLPGEEARLVSGKGASRSDKANLSEITNALQGVEANSVRAGFTPKKVAATILVPESYIKALWMRNNGSSPNEDGTMPEPTEADLTAERTKLMREIKESVANMISPDVTDKSIVDFQSLVHVSTFTEIIPEIKETVVESGLFSWLGEQWQSLALIGMIILGLGVLWSLTRPKSADSIVIYESPGISSEELDEEEEEEEEMKTPIDRVLEPFGRSMRSLQQEAADLVVENPDAAASVLRQWIGNVAALQEK